MNSLRGTRPRREFYCNCSRGARILPKAFCFGCWIARFGHSPLAGVAGMLCRRTAKLQVRCARGGGRGCVGCGARARGGAASLRTCAVRLRRSGRGSRLKPHRVGRALCARRPTFSPLNNSVFAPPQKHLMHLECIKRACDLRPNAETSVANAVVMGVARWVQGVRRSLRWRGAEGILGLKGVRA